MARFYLTSLRMSLAANWRKRGLFEHVKFIFPNAPRIPITVVCIHTLECLEITLIDGAVEHGDEYAWLV